MYPYVVVQTHLGGEKLLPAEEEVELGFKEVGYSQVEDHPQIERNDKQNHSTYNI